MKYTRIDRSRKGKLQVWEQLVAAVCPSIRLQKDEKTWKWRFRMFDLQGESDLLLAKREKKERERENHKHDKWMNFAFLFDMKDKSRNQTGITNALSVVTNLRTTRNRAKCGWCDGASATVTHTHTHLEVSTCQAQHLRRVSFGLKRRMAQVNYELPCVPNKMALPDTMSRQTARSSSSFSAFGSSKRVWIWQVMGKLLGCDFQDWATPSFRFGLPIVANCYAALYLVTDRNDRQWSTYDVSSFPNFFSIQSDRPSKSFWPEVRLKCTFDPAEGRESEPIAQSENQINQENDNKMENGRCLWTAFRSEKEGTAKDERINSEFNPERNELGSLKWRQKASTSRGNRGGSDAAVKQDRDLNINEKRRKRRSWRRSKRRRSTNKKRRRKK